MSPSTGTIAVEAARVRVGSGTGLAPVRRLEAAGFRAWPAAHVSYDGTWAVRLTASHSAKRLNSINPLDPGDDADIGERIARASLRFAACGRSLTFRLSPLASPRLTAHFDREGWSSFSDSLVMRAPLDEAMLSAALDHIPLQDMGRFINAEIAIGNLEPALGQGLSDVIASIQPQAGLFVLEPRGKPVSTAVCVQDGDLAGLFEIATDPDERGMGYARRTVLSALKWAYGRGARTGWLQVEASNAVAIGLYRSLGFEEIYRYHYRQPPTGEAS